LQDRLKVLERHSAAHLAAALRAPSGDVCAPRDAYQAGYVALMSTLSEEEVRSIADHPNPDAAVRATDRLGLSSEDREHAAAGAASYYSPETSMERPLSEQIEWARRVRTAAGWPAELSTP